MNKITSAIAASVPTLALLCGAARAAGPVAPTEVTPTPAPEMLIHAAPYAEGDRDIQAYGGAYRGIRKGDHFESGAACFEYFVRDDLGLFAEGVGYSFGPRDGGDGPGEGFNVGTRWRFLKLGRAAIFAEGLLGVFTANDAPFPSRGTRFNFTEQAGLGVEYRLTDNIGFIAGGRYVHMSNASLHGGDFNPGFDGVGAYGGLTIRF